MMEMVRITPDRFDDVIDHLRKSFFVDEPLCKAVQLCLPGETHLELETYSRAALKDGLSVMALNENNQIAGVALNGIISPGDTETALKELSAKADNDFKTIFNLLYTENLKMDLFNRFGIEKIFEIRILSVDTDFRGQGLAKKLLDRSIKIAMENMFTIIKTDATAICTQKCSESLGFRTIADIRYDSWKNEDGSLKLLVPEPHQSLKIMIKEVTAAV